MTEPKQQALLVKAIGRIGLGLYAHANYLARAAPITTAEDLSRHAIIGFDRDAASLAQVEAVWPNLPPFALRTDNQLAQIAMGRAGFVIGVVQDPIARRDPALMPLLHGEVRAYLPHPRLRWHSSPPNARSAGLRGRKRLVRLGRLTYTRPWAGLDRGGL